MVSRIIKKTPTKTIKSNRHRRKKTPVKNASTAAASAVVASINKSLYTCHRRLIKIFSKLARIATPKKKSPRKQGYQLLHKTSRDSPKNGVIRALFDDRVNRVPLPPLASSKKGTVFLDLDETLVHSKPGLAPEKYDFIVRPVIDGEKVDFFVLKRPFADELLEVLSKDFEVVVFTAGIEEYASQVLDKIDQKGLISHRLYRDSCKEVDGKFVKDLSDLGRDLKRVVIVDDNPNSYVFQPENAIPVLPFVDDLEDGELKKLIQIFEQFGGEVEDMRDIIKNYADKFLLKGIGKKQDD